MTAHLQLDLRRVAICRVAFRQEHHPYLRQWSQANCYGSVAKIIVAFLGQLDAEDKMVWGMMSGVQNGLAKSDITYEHGYLWIEGKTWQEYQQFTLIQMRLAL
ncbi:hypothetical protein EOK75_15920 (plasmid) [Pseudorhodobacter turbinis]|uniref:Uncharacterized protein n=1 Tax=Pseudorhodobacter turbinis TaxID=2500533 RepID=A0A4P8EK37_9RHOB|nr:hypothetical protein [Pseudorhodobacter turbinis]QCO57243.1 hypothetical protein EOK75_15920 [Pseudorhodobacter turbinis]